MSTYVVGFRATNFLCYRGENEIELGPGIFALVAERDGDPRRSNAQGKSAFLWAFRFVLNGDHPKRTEDEWITDGELEGGVDVELSNGAFFSRWRRRGDATRLKVILPEPDPRFEDNRPLELLGDQAQAAIDRIVGFNKHEQKSTWWCEQGKVDAFINGDASDVTEDIVRWCGIEPVRRACKRVAEELRGLLAGDERLLAVHADARATLARALCVVELQDMGADEGREQEAAARRELIGLEDTVAALERSVAEDATLKERERERSRLEAKAREYDDTVAAKTDIERRLALAPEVSAPKLAQAREKQAKLRTLADKAKAEVDQKRRLARGEFDGCCPVGGIQCPVKEQLNADAAASRQLLEKVEPLLADAEKDRKDAAAVLQRLEEQADERAELEADLKHVGERLKYYKHDWEAFRALAQVATPEGVAEVEAELAGKRASRDALRRRLEAIAAARQKMVECEAAREALAPDITARREALQLLGPSGAQRRLADGFLSKVEHAANRDLGDAGVDIRVRFHWQRELDDPADACAQCGQPFPSSRKVKVCQSCAAPRGRKIEQKFRCEVSPKSGGMDALAGVGTRFSSTAWLKARRASGWAVACLDEPLSAVDEHNRALVGRHLVRMLGAHYGIEQAFISAHDRSLLDSLPRRIVVRGSEQGSTLEVVG